MPAQAEATTPSAADRTAIVRRLCRWYDREKRELPWRETRDPYAIWVSEIMLQQTRVDTVIPYYQRFLEAFPTVEALAAAPIEQVLGLWSGLGYYRRARQLALAASEVVERYGGEVPSEAERLRELSGIGRYTAGAIASIAFGEAVPVVDGNVIRVLSRLFGLEDDMRRQGAQREVWDLAAGLVPSDDPGRFNQALMELGATVCRPVEPRCEACPLASRCEARVQGRTGELPFVSGKKAPRPVAAVAMVVAHGSSGRVLLARRKDDGLFGGLWEPPLVMAKDLDSAHSRLRPLGLRRGARLEEVGSVRHLLTHRRFEVRVMAGRARRQWRLPSQVPDPYRDIAWRRPDAVALSTMARKLLRCAGVKELGS